MAGRNVKEMLTDMKDYSVLTVDLAYCSVLFADKEMAKEVISLSKKIDSLRYVMEKSVLMAATSGVKEEELIGILRLAAYSERISNIAAEIANTVLSGQIHEIEKKALNEAEEKFVRLKVKKEMSGKLIADVGIGHNIWVIAIKRKKEWIHHPSAKFQLKSGDILFGIK